MSQVLAKQKNSILYQDFEFKNQNISLKTMVSNAACYICDKGLDEGFSVTAKSTRNGITLYCEKHYSNYEVL